MTLGLIPYVTIKGRKSGKMISTPVTPYKYMGQTYLVSPRGETHWVRNLRAAKKGILTTKKKPLPFTATEVRGKLRDEIVASYRKDIKIAENQFKKLPSISDHPVFRVV